MRALCGGRRPRCAVCGDRRPWALVVDHTHGGGVKDRTTRGHSSTWKLVVRDYHAAGKVWPVDRYRVLCANCNQRSRLQPGTVQRMTTNSTRNAIKSYVKVFAATIFSLFLASGADVLAVSWSDLRTWLAAGLASVLPLVITALDPHDVRFGRHD